MKHLVAFLLLIGWVQQLDAQIAFTSSESRCEASGSITMTVGVSLPVGLSLSEAQIVILGGPLCSAGACPLPGSTPTEFFNLPAGDYEVGVVNSTTGIVVYSEMITVQGTYEEPRITAGIIPACEGDENAWIYIENTSLGNDPYQYRVFPGSVTDYTLPIGPSQNVLPFAAQDTFKMIDADSNLLDENTGAESNIPNSNENLWTVQVQDSCNVIRTIEVVVEELGADFTSLFRPCNGGCGFAELRAFSYRTLDGSYVRLNELSETYQNLFPLTLNIVKNEGSGGTDTYTFDFDDRGNIGEFLFELECDFVYDWSLTSSCGIKTWDKWVYRCLPTEINKDSQCG